MNIQLNPSKTYRYERDNLSKCGGIYSEGQLRCLYKKGLWARLVQWEPDQRGALIVRLLDLQQFVGLLSGMVFVGEEGS